MGRTLFQNQKTQGKITDRFRIMASRKDACIKGGMTQRKGEILDDEKWFGKTTFSKPT